MNILRIVGRAYAEDESICRCEWVTRRQTVNVDDFNGGCAANSCTLDTCYITVCCTGGVFEHDIERQVRAVLRQAVNDVNSNPHLLPDIRLDVDLEFIPPHDSFAASRAGKQRTLVVAVRRRRAKEAVQLIVWKDK